MSDTMKNEKSKIITIIGMAVMIIVVAVKAATGSVIAAAAIHVAGLACFFITEGTDLDRQELKNLGNMRFPRFFFVSVSFYRGKATASR